jgi:hypothetical protein
MAYWTMRESRRIEEAHRTDCPTIEDLAAMFPRHTRKEITHRARYLGIKRNQQRARWLKIARDYWAKRAAECGVQPCPLKVGCNGSDHSSAWSES